MLGLRPPVPFTVFGTVLLPEGSGGLAFWRSMATVPVEDIHLRLNLTTESVTHQ